MVINMKNKKGIKTLSIVLIILGVTTILFTASMILLFYKFQSIPDTLCERFFTCVVGELGIAGLIQIAKTICTNIFSKNINPSEEYPSDEYSEEYPNDELSEGDDLNE